MPEFTYVARDPAGSTQTGSAVASSPSAVADQLRQRGWLVTEVRAAGDGLSQGETWSPASLLRVRSVDVEVSLRQLAVMLRSGLSLLRALQVVPEQSRRPRMAAVWRDVARRIQTGSSFADALSAHGCFTNLVVQLVRVGEQTGTLEPVLVRAAGALERRRLLRNAVLSALLYPTIVVLMTIGVTAFVVFYLLPKLKAFLLPLGRQLPPMTQLLLDISDLVQAHLAHVSIGLFAALAGCIAVALWPPGRRVLDRLLLRVPIVGRVVSVSATVQTARSLRDLLASGVTLLEALRTVELLISNRHLRGLLARSREQVMQGSGLAGPLSVKGGFQPMLAAMVAVGEQAGTLDEVLGEVAEFHEQELQTIISTLSVLIEPVLIITVGGIVGFVYVSVFMALYAAY